MTRNKIIQFGLYMLISVFVLVSCVTEESYLTPQTVRDNNISASPDIAISETPAESTQGTSLEISNLSTPIITATQTIVPKLSYMILKINDDIVAINPYSPNDIDYLMYSHYDEVPNPRPEKLSPDGTKLIINTISAVVKKYRLYILDLQNDTLQQLLKEDADQIFPQWSPDGESIVLVLRTETESGIYTVDQDGSNLNYLPAAHRWDYLPFWSPGGDKIYFISSEEKEVFSLSDIYVMEMDGTNIQKLTSEPIEIRNFSLSPDGTKIIYSVQNDNRNIYIMNSDGSNLKNLSIYDAQDRAPIWSPDSSKIAFSSDRDGSWELYLMDTDGSNVERLTNDPEIDIPMYWSPHGEYLAFLSDRSGTWQIHLFFMKDRSVQQITKSDSYPDIADIWSKK